jgi:hypothetical protein
MQSIILALLKHLDKISTENFSTDEEDRFMEGQVGERLFH